MVIVIDGLTPSMFEAADTPAIRFLAEHGEYRRASSVFPSLTPVCLASISTGAYPDVHEIPHLVWWNREERRIVETHPEIGDKLLEPLDLLSSARPVVRHHHERWDGAGYPDRPAEAQIPLGARIVAVADSVEVMTSPR